MKFTSEQNPPYQTVIVTKGSTDEDQSERINGLLTSVPNHSRVSFEAGVYFLCHALELNGKKDIVMDGNGATLAPYFDRESYGDRCEDAIHVTDCTDITIRDFKVDSPVPVNSAGRIVQVSQNWFDVRFDDCFPCTGKEKYIAGYTFSEFGYPTYCDFRSPPYDYSQWDMVAHEIPCTAPRHLDAPHEKIGDHLVRVHCAGMANVPLGTRYSVRHAYYGPAAFLFRHTENVLIEDVKVTNFGGMVFVILPRCLNFTFRRVVIAPEHTEYQFYSSNADGIHTTGLGGSLTIEDCCFRNLGDDILNSHTLAMRAKTVQGERLQLYFDKHNGTVPKKWALTGDILRVYDPDTLTRRRDMRVVSADGADITVESGSDIREGDLVINSLYFPEIRIERCTCYNLRSRAFVVQNARKLLIKDCSFYNVTGCAAYLSSGFQRFYEVGPWENAEITGNLFVGCKMWSNPQYAAITAWLRGDYKETIRDIHHHLSIHDNRFENLVGQPIYTSAVRGVTIRDNEFIQCRDSIPSIIVENCSDVAIADNRTWQNGMWQKTTETIQEVSGNTHVPY